jgi:hypothetical protein
VIKSDNYDPEEVKEFFNRDVIYFICNSKTGSTNFRTHGENIVPIHNHKAFEPRNIKVKTTKIINDNCI